MTTIKDEKSKALSVILAFIVLFTCIFSYPIAESHAITVEKLVTKYHLDIGVQQIWGTEEDKSGNVIWDNGIGPGDDMNVKTSIPFPQEIYNVKVYPYSASKFQWGEPNYSSNVGSESYYKINYEDYTSINIHDVTNVSASGNTVTFSHTAKMSSSLQYDVAKTLCFLQIDDIFRLMAGPEPTDPEAAVSHNFPDLYSKLNQGRNGVDSKVHAYMYFTPVIIQYDVKEMVEIGDFEPDLNLPDTAKQGETFTPADASNIDDKITVEEAVLERRFNGGAWEHVITWRGTGTPGANTGERIDQIGNEIGIIEYRITVRVTNGEEKSKTKTISIIDGREIDGEAILNIPKFTYEGHPALAQDASEFEVDGVDYSAARAYEENIADNSFDTSVSYGKVSRLTSIKANVTFSKKGNYTVTLDVDLINGSKLSDTKPIEVRKTPYIIDNLGGFQKENRKQILNISVATYPGKPIVDYYVELTDLKTGQTITLTPTQPQINNVTIKTRTITLNSDQYWSNYELLFLTKNTTSQDYKYTIYMKDSKGDTDTVSKTFTVAPDLPPNAQIYISDNFIRNKGTNTSEIQVEDNSTTDGDQLQRTWTVKDVNVQSLPGFKDNSFGSRQKIQYNKTGVGKDTINLFVKDVWTEPTLEEYITSSDYLSASITATTEVINIAPTVRLEPIETETADIAIVTEKASESGIKAGINSIKAALIEAGIDANVQVIPTAKPNSDGYKRIGHYEWDVAINDQTQHSTGLIYDSEYVYVIEAAGFEMSGYQEVCIPPYTIKALKSDGTALTTAWSYTVSESTNFKLKTDSSENYIYLACNDLGKTILLNRKNGAYVTTLPVVIPSNPFTTANNNNLYFLFGDNIQKYDPDTETLKTVINKGGSLGRIQNGKITFVGSEDSHKFYIGQFNMNTETITQKSIPELEEFEYEAAGWSKSSVSPTDMDTTGKVTFTQTLKNNYNDIRGIIIWLADSEEQKVYNLGRVESPMDMKANSLGFVKDETGKALYMYHAYSDDNSTSSNTRRYFSLYLYTLGDGDTLPTKRTIYSEKNNRWNWNGIFYAKYHSQEDAIYIMQGSRFESSDWGGSYSGVMCRIQLPAWSADFNEYNWDWDIAEEKAAYNDYLVMTYYDYESWTGSHRRVKMFSNSITKEQAEESALTRLAVFAQEATKYIEKNFTDVKELVDKIKEAVKKKTSLKLDITDEKQISLSRSYNLKLGQTYYYEFEVKKPKKEDSKGDTGNTKLNVTAPEIIFNSKNNYTGSENLGTYYVTKTYLEDFNNSKLDPFFTYVNGNIDGKLTTPRTTKGSYNRDIKMTATVKFTIPEGKKAIAMMDVTGHKNAIWKSGVYINGQRYDKQPKTGYDIKDYIHPYLLKEGENTIQAYTCWYGRGDDGCCISIDNLKIIFIEENVNMPANTFSSMLTEDGWTKAIGSFQTPQEILEFKSQKMTHLDDWPPELTTSSNGQCGYYDFTIPSESVAKIYATFQGYTLRKDSTAGNFTFPNWSETHIGTKNCSDTNSYLSYLRSGETYFTGDYQNEVRFSTKAGSKGSVSFPKLETYIYPENLKDKNDFFFADNKVYSINNTFDGKTDVKINLNSDEINTELLMQNFKIYYINNGNKVYLYSKPLKDTSELSGWTITENVTANMYTETKPEKEEDIPLVYKKGQLVSYNIFYDDYENDPSKKQYWRYTHTPYNDGPHPNAAYVLDEDGNIISSTGAILEESITRFYIDGKYTVEHWQEDNTNRTGDTSGETDYTLYDKKSNVESITFYVEGGATAPWITSIKTIPVTVKEGDEYGLQIGVDDAEKDVLNLTTEVYKEKKLIYTHRQKNITASNSVYPYIYTDIIKDAEVGRYDVVCTVRDQTGAGLGSYKFMVVSDGKITGEVYHTEQWDINRKKFNLSWFKDEVNREYTMSEYMASGSGKMVNSGSNEKPRKRGTNVFWSGERFMLNAAAAGTPTKVTCQIKDYTYSTVMKNTGKKNKEGEAIYQGAIWEESMINKWGKKEPEQLTFEFTANYAGGTKKTHEVKVIVDNINQYWRLHRVF